MSGVRIPPGPFSLGTVGNDFEHSLTQGTTTTKSTKSDKLGQKLGHLLTLPQTAAKLSVSPKTVRRWCESGKIPAIPKPYGNTVTYLISPHALEHFLTARATKQAKSPSNKAKSHADYIAEWKQSMAKGTLTGKVYSPRTARDYAIYVECFFKRYKTLTVASLKAEIARVLSHQFATKDKLYKSLLCFSKYLIMEEALEEDFTAKIKRIAPKRHIPPKRFTVTPEGLESLVEATTTPLNRLLVVLLSNTGLRASEACYLTIEDIDLEKQTLLVRQGKGNKSRKLGLNKEAIEALQDYLAHRKPKGTNALLLNRNGKPMDANGLYQRIERLGRLSGVKASPHALRRAFVTINANKGRPLQMLQMACGHADITTTRDYCLTTEQEVIEAMRGW